jgi:ketosteroid isomerase-like protein
LVCRASWTLAEESWPHARHACHVLVKGNRTIVSETESKLALARRYLAALERGVVGDELAAFFAPDVVQEEFPNRLMPNGARRDLAALIEGAERGQTVISAQRFEVTNAIAHGDRVALEVRWTGTLAVPVGSLSDGDEMRARFAVFLEYRDDKIIRQRNYDCYEPW